MNNDHAASFDGVHRKAVDKLAASMFFKGVKYDSSPKPMCPHWDTPPPMRKPPSNAPKLIGVKFGRFTVIGLHKTLLGSWVCRCDCGDYEIRKAKSVRNPNNFGDRCKNCRNTVFERKDYEFRKNGIELDQRNL